MKHENQSDLLLATTHSSSLNFILEVTYILEFYQRKIFRLKKKSEN